MWPGSEKADSPEQNVSNEGNSRMCNIAHILCNVAHFRRATRDCVSREDRARDSCFMGISLRICSSAINASISAPARHRQSPRCSSAILASSRFAWPTLPRFVPTLSRLSPGRFWTLWECRSAYLGVDRTSGNSGGISTKIMRGNLF